MTEQPCQNCKAPNADLVSFDMDLPTVRLCRLCSVTISSDPELFDDMGKRSRRRKA